MTERLHFHFSLWCIGEGNGNPLQCSCMENPRDRGPWWAAVYRVTQSRTRLKWLSGLAGKDYVLIQVWNCCWEVTVKPETTFPSLPCIKLIPHDWSQLMEWDQSFLFYTWQCTYVNLNFPIHSSPSTTTPLCVHISDPYIWISIPALQIGSSLPFSTATLEKRMDVCEKTKKGTTLWLSNPTPRHIPWENCNSKRHRNPNVHCSTIYNSQDMEAT